MYFAIWCTNKSDKYPQVQKGLLSTASYASQHPSFYDHIMCTHMKHVWLWNDERHSIRNRCAEMWQGQTIRCWLVLKFWIINVGLCSCSISSITCPLGVIDYKNKIISIGTAMYTRSHLNTQALLWLWKESRIVQLNFTVHTQFMCWNNELNIGYIYKDHRGWQHFWLTV